ncbi:phiSA1p31-related protein [Streptomyces cavourensis]|nr:phiSA1p31-related protein [Streptomyces cavourensis]
MNTTFVHEGIEFDLTLTYADTTGVEWNWTGEQINGVPLMAQKEAPPGCDTPWKFTDLYWELGPLIAISSRPTVAQYRAAVDPDYAATVAAGYVEARIAAAVAPGLAVGHLPPSPLGQTGFRRFIRSLQKGGA